LVAVIDAESGGGPRHGDQHIQSLLVEERMEVAEDRGFRGVPGEPRRFEGHFEELDRTAGGTRELCPELAGDLVEIVPAERVENEHPPGVILRGQRGGDGAREDDAYAEPAQPNAAGPASLESRDHRFRLSFRAGRMAESRE
jgi:hypothetical protein